MLPEKPFALVLLLVMAATLLLVFLPQPVLAATQITTCTELQNIRDDLGGEYYLGNDIDCTGTSGWNGGAGFVPIGNGSNNFTGTFDGQGYKITGLYINRSSSDFVGLFGLTNSGSEIKNVGLEEVNVNGSCAGGLVGGTDGGTIANCYSSGSVRGDRYVGGLVGINYRAAKIANSYSTGSVNGDINVGGLVGYNFLEGTITNCYSTGSVNGDVHVGGLVGWNEMATITNCYSTGCVSGSSDVGGLVGSTYEATVTNSYWDITTSRQLTSTGGEGKTTTEMKQRATFANWDFDTIWAIVEDESYPYLQWQPGPPVPVPVFSITGLVVVIGMMCLVLAVAVSRRRR